MPKSIEELVEAAELAVFARKKLSLRAASDARLPGSLESFSTRGLRARKKITGDAGAKRYLQHQDRTPHRIRPSMHQRPRPHRPEERPGCSWVTPGTTFKDQSLTGANRARPGPREALAGDTLVVT